MAIEVLNGGPMTTVQDRGRFGCQKSGIRACGVMDTDAYEAACQLCGLSSSEEDGAAVLEMTLLGGSFRLVGDVWFAITGADMKAQLNGTPCPSYTLVHGKTGDVLSFGVAVTGCRTYVAFAGGIDVPKVMGSRSTDVKCSMGGFHGRALQKGDVLPLLFAEKISLINDEASRNKIRQPLYGHSVKVRTIPGPQDDRFTDAGLKTFFSEAYVVTGDSDRMGCRLSGPVVESKDGTDIISDGIVFGSVQISAAGLPIILMADRQTAGGYAKIGTVCTADLPLLAQCRPGDKVRFVRTEVEELR